jgi:hypothetical protein
VDLLKNDIPVEQAQELVKIMQSKEKLITLCGLSGNEATLDFSNQRLGPGDAVLIANDISDMGALLLLDISQNDFFADRILGEGIQMNEAATDALMQALSTNKVLTSINISDTLLCGGCIIKQKPRELLWGFQCHSVSQALQPTQKQCKLFSNSPVISVPLVCPYPYDFLCRTWGR